MKIQFEWRFEEDAHEDDRQPARSRVNGCTGTLGPVRVHAPANTYGQGERGARREWRGP